MRTVGMGTAPSMAAIASWCGSTAGATAISEHFARLSAWPAALRHPSSNAKSGADLPQCDGHMVGKERDARRLKSKLSHVGAHKCVCSHGVQSPTHRAPLLDAPADSSMLDGQAKVQDVRIEVAVHRLDLAREPQADAKFTEKTPQPLVHQARERCMKSSRMHAGLRPVRLNSCIAQIIPNPRCWPQAVPDAIRASGRLQAFAMNFRLSRARPTDSGRRP